MKVITKINRSNCKQTYTAWDVSNVTNMERMFSEETIFNNILFQGVQIKNPTMINMFMVQVHFIKIEEFGLYVRNNKGSVSWCKK